jgi:1-deoxy-D-xylulose-5-phosphate reductoisomerase
MKRVTILGATGSVGRRTLELIAEFPGEFQVEGLAARGSQIELLRDLILKHRPKAVALLDKQSVDALARQLPSPRPQLLSGSDGVTALARETEADVVVSALVGGAGLLPTMAAIEAGKDIALANKETLVMAGGLMTAAARAHNVSLLPVDSEHNAIFQCLQGHHRGEVRRICLTASGGPFFRKTREELTRVTREEALRHPTWQMGAKITIDSATLMNKGLEIIEAHWLFGFSLDQIRVVIHPQSIIHSMVEYVDGSVIAQMAVADMGIPILYALTYPHRLPCPAPSLELTKVGQLTFYEPDHEAFPCLGLARHALADGGTAPSVLNAANEVAVAAFLEGQICFSDIASLIDAALSHYPAEELRSLEECLSLDREVRRWVTESIGTLTAAQRM